MEISLIVGIKNRVQHFVQTFPFLISQRGVEYELIIVDFYSKDSLQETFNEEYDKRRETISEDLKQIKYIRINEDLKYNPRKVKNLGAECSEGEKIAFTDVDVFLAMDYLNFWYDKIVEQKSFLATRVQDTSEQTPSRISPETNYGNMIVSRKDFYNVGGWDESSNRYGGDDDDIFHRLKLTGLREINPLNKYDSRQYSILHGDELRLKEFEIPERQRLTRAQICSNKNYLNKNNSFFSYENYKKTMY